MQGVQAAISTETKKSRSPAGPRRLRNSDAHKRIAAPKAFCVLRSVSDQDPKAAKFAVLNPGHAGFPKRVERSEGSNSAPIRNAPVSACGPLCAILWVKPRVYPLSGVKANVGRLCEKLKDAMKSGWGIKFMAVALPNFLPLLIVGVHREPGNVCI